MRRRTRLQVPRRNAKIAEGFARKLDSLHPSLKGFSQTNEINLKYRQFSFQIHTRYSFTSTSNVVSFRRKSFLIMVRLSFVYSKELGNKLSNAPDCLMKTIIKCTEFTIILSKAQNRIRLIEWTKQIVRTKLVSKGLKWSNVSEIKWVIYPKSRIRI